MFLWLNFLGNIYASSPVRMALRHAFNPTALCTARHTSTDVTKFDMAKISKDCPFICPCEYNLLAHFDVDALDEIPWDQPEQMEVAIKMLSPHLCSLERAYALQKRTGYQPSGLYPKSLQKEKNSNIPMMIGITGLGLTVGGVIFTVEFLQSCPFIT